jgi:hypothetical protein
LSASRQNPCLFGIYFVAPFVVIHRSAVNDYSVVSVGFMLQHFGVKTHILYFISLLETF